MSMEALDATVSVFCCPVGLRLPEDLTGTFWPLFALSIDSSRLSLLLQPNNGEIHLRIHSYLLSQTVSGISRKAVIHSQFLRTWCCFHWHGSP